MMHGRCAVLLLGSMILTLAVGCDTIREDFDGLFDTIAPKSPTEAALMAVNPNNPDERREGTTLLANAPFGGEEPYLRMFRDYVQNDRDPLVKAAAARGLARHGAPEDAVLIAALLQDESVVVRWEAAKGLQRLHNPAVVRDLIRSLSDEGEETLVRVAAAVALGQYPEGRVVQGLIGGLNARGLAINRAAHDSLVLLTGADIDMDARAWLDWYDGAVVDGTVFDGQTGYLYPTYRRSIRWYEHIAFWTDKTFERPNTPIGLRPADERSTYETDEEAVPHQTYEDG